MNRWRVRWSTKPLCCSGVLVGTNRMLALVTASDGLCIRRVILLPFDIGFDVGRRHQPYRMTKCLQLARPMVRRGASFDADQALRQLLEKRKDVPTLQLAADDHLAGSINSVNLEDRLRNVETDCRGRLHG